MLISTAKHKRIVAEKDAEIAGLMKRIKTLEGCLQVGRISENSMVVTIYELRARLAPFTKIRNRDSRGRFIKDTVA